MRLIEKLVEPFLVVTLLLTATSVAQAQNYPLKPVRIIVSLSAGGAVDVMARLVAQQLAQRLGQPFLVENRPGAGGMLGAQAVAKSPPDGYTLLVGANQDLTVTPNMQESSGYDPLRDLVPVMKAVTVPMVVTVPAASSIGSMRDLLAQAAATHGKLSYGTSAPGSPMHLALESLKELAGVDYTHVPYKGAAPVVTDLLSGQIQFAGTGVGTVINHVRAGRLRAIAIIGETRTGLLPEVPTIREATGYATPDYPVWYGFSAPAGVPREILDKLEQEIGAALTEPEAKAKLVASGVDVVALPGAKYAATLPVESATFGTALTKFNIRMH